MRGKRSRKSKSEKRINYRIVPAAPCHGRGVYEAICLANDFDPNEHITGVFGLDTWADTLAACPGGQFVAVTERDGDEKVVGLAVSMRTNYAPFAKPLSWRDMIGDLSLRNNDAKGAWLYGVEKAVHPEFQGRGIGSALYKAQFGLVKRLGLRGMYAGGMLKGYKHHRGEMSVREYARRVMRGELFDPTVSVQMRKGFKPLTIIENYAWDHEAAHAGMLIVYEAPKAPRRPRAKLSTSSLSV